MPATIKDVARMAGCSIKTVSRVINNEPYVTDDTRARVMSAVRAVGYAPNISARRLVQRKSFMVCILMYPGFFHPASNLLASIMDIGYEQNYDILIQPYFPTHARSKNKLVNLINEQRMDGFVTTPPCDSDEFVVDLLNTYKVPFVQISPYARRSGFPFVEGDDYQGAYNITEHLIHLGHRSIASLMGPRNIRPAHDRQDGYRAALEASGIAWSPEMTLDSEFTFDGGHTAGQILLQRPDRPTAIFAGSDEAAFGVLIAAREAGLRVPEDLSVCGFDDVPFGKQVWPALTTVHQPAEEMVELAVRLLIDLLKGSPVTSTQIHLPSRLVLRESSSVPPQNS